MTHFSAFAFDEFWLKFWLVESLLETGGAPKLYASFGQVLGVDWIQVFDPFASWIFELGHFERLAILHRQVDEHGRESGDALSRDARGNTLVALRPLQECMVRRNLKRVI